MKFGTLENCMDLLENGTIFCNPITGFIEEDGTWRQDKNENVNELAYGDLRVKIRQFPDISVSQIPAQLRFKNPPVNNIYCLSTIDFTKPFNNGKYYIDKRFKTDFGKYFVLIHNTTEFANRLSKAINELGYPVAHKLVTYKPLKQYTGQLDDFTKDESFSWQNEYRFKFYTGMNEKLIINIKNIEDIACLMPSDTEYLEFEIK